MPTKIYPYNSTQIGGNVVVIETEKSKIAIDYGANLPGSKLAEVDIDGISKGKSEFDGVFFTHYHGDHTGNMRKINADIPLYLGEVARQIMLNISGTLKDQEMVNILENRIKELHVNEPVSINDGDMIITPYMVDHSAYEAFMFLIETKDQTILHTGDFRRHGYRGKALIDMIRTYIRQFGKRKIDVLITEGTMLSRMNEEVFTEWQLQEWAKNYMKTHRYVFLVCSSTNFDTLASFYHAAQSNRISMFANGYVFKQLKTMSVMAGKYTPLYNFQRVYKKEFHRKLKKNGFEGTQEEFMRKYGFLCVVKEGKDYEKWIDTFQDLKPVVIYSEWDGYRDRSRENIYNAELDAFCNKYNAISKHTSGHATAKDIKEVIEAVAPKKIIPIHTEEPEKLAEVLKGTVYADLIEYH